MPGRRGERHAASHPKISPSIERTPATRHEMQPGHADHPARPGPWFSIEKEGHSIGQALAAAFRRRAIKAIRPVAIAPRTYVEGSGTPTARKAGDAAPVLQLN